LTYSSILTNNRKSREEIPLTILDDEGKLSKEALVEAIRKVGPEQTVISSDLGQMGRASPVQGLRDCIKELLAEGIKEEGIDLMLRINPARLLNLE